MTFSLGKLRNKPRRGSRLRTLYAKSSDYFAGLPCGRAEVRLRTEFMLRWVAKNEYETEIRELTAHSRWM